MTPEETATALRDLDALAGRLRKLRDRARSARRRAWQSWTPEDLARINAASETCLLPYIRRCTVALRAGREPDRRDLVVGIAAASPPLGRLFAHGLRENGVAEAAVARFTADRFGHEAAR